MRGQVIRPARASDLPAIARISAANDEPVADPDRPGSRYLDHLLAHARLLVAESDAGVAGFAGAIDVPAGWFLTDLFVDPAVHGQGIGRALLAEVFPEPGPRLTFSSADPRALPIYVRAGMSPWWPLLYVRPPSDDRRPPEAPGASGRQLTLELVDGDTASAVERALTGHDRAREWALWAARPGARPFLLLDAGRPAAVGATAPPWLGRLVIGRAADPVAAVLGAIAAATTGPLAGLAIPGPHPATRVLLDLGWRIEGADTHMASGPDLLDPTRLLPDPSLA
jgi:putative acetyltransferase